MPPQLKKQFILHSRKPHFHRNVEKARARITEFLEITDAPYIAFSGGKDSHCCLELVREQRQETPAVYFDADCAYPSLTALLDRTDNVIRFKCEPFLETLKREGIYHGKTPSPFMISTVYEPIQRLLNETDFDGCIYGLRAEESAARRANAGRRGAVFQYAEKSIHRGTWACQPIYDWTYQDVWAFIVSRGIDYCAEYDNLWELSHHEQRLSYWAGFSNRSFGRLACLKRNHPDLFAQLTKVCPEARHFV